jgi:hypothetical protein
MRYVKSTVMAAFAALLLAAGVAAAQDMNMNRTTHVTFGAPVQVPGMTLQAGTYTFRLADPKSDNHLVQILDGNGEKLVTTVVAMPARRLHTTEENVVTFHEAPEAAPQALRYWYYPNDSMGHEFAYPKNQALLIAKANNEPVLAVAGKDIVRVEPEASATVAQPPAQQPPAEHPAVRQSARAGRLPKTASELPVVGLIGLLALGGALIARALRAAV